jgi:hypothetical protein
MTARRYTLLTEHALPLSAALSVLGVGVAAWPYTVDDAFIVARYAANLAAGHGYAMNPLVPSDGVTGPLWLLPEVLADLVGCDPITCAKLVGLACVVWAVWLAVARVQRRSEGRLAACATTFLLALSPSLGTWAVAGIETGAATLLSTVAALAATRRPSPSVGMLGSSIAALAWLRPEMAFFSLVLLAWIGLRESRSGARAAMLGLFGVTSVTAFRLICFGDWLPLAYYAKAGSIAFGLRYGAEALILSTSLFGVWLVILGSRHGRNGDRVLATALVAHFCAVVLAGGDWMPGYRLLVPVLPVYAALAGIGVVRAFRRRRWLGLGMLIMAGSVPALDLATRIPELRAAGQSRVAVRELASWLHKHARVVALVDIGYLGYSSGAEVVDLAGLTDGRIARMPGGHLSKRISPAYLRERHPDVIVLHSVAPPDVGADGRLRAFDGFAVEQDVARMPFVRAGFRVARVIPYAPNYHYIVLRSVKNHQIAPR